MKVSVVTVETTTVTKTVRLYPEHVREAMVEYAAKHAQMPEGSSSRVVFTNHENYDEEISCCDLSCAVEFTSNEVEETIE